MKPIQIFTEIPRYSGTPSTYLLHLLSYSSSSPTRCSPNNTVLIEPRGTVLVVSRPMMHIFKSQGVGWKCRLRVKCVCASVMCTVRGVSFLSLPSPPSLPHILSLHSLFCDVFATSSFSVTLSASHTLSQV